MYLETSVAIAAPAPTVWDVLTDIETWPQWTASTTRVRRLDGGPLRIGSRARLHQPRLLPAVWTVVDLTPTTFTWTAHTPGAATVAYHDLSPHPDGSTTVRLAIDQTGALAPLLTPLLGALTRRYLHLEAQGLKHRAEDLARSR